MRKGVSFLLGFVIIAILLVSAGMGNAFSQDISRPPATLGLYGTLQPNGATITLFAHERTGTLDAGPDGLPDGGVDDVRYTFFTFGDTAASVSGMVPGPFIRCKQGNTYTFKIDNTDPVNARTHSIDFHAVMGFMGGATVLSAAPGGTAELTAELMHAGLFMYHCVGDGASNIPSIAEHISNGMYGMILVEPMKTGGGSFKVDKGKADKEFYVMQSEFYLNDTGVPPTCCDASVHTLAIGKGLLEEPDYVVFNGRAGVERTTLKLDPTAPAGALLGTPPRIVTPVIMGVNVGDDVIIYFGNMGPNFISSPHMIGGMWDREYHQGDVNTKPLKSIATATVPAAGTAVFAFRIEEPGIYALVDHAVYRVAKGALGLMLTP